MEENNKSFQEIEVIDVNTPSIKNENMKIFNMIELVKSGEEIYALPNMGIKKQYNNNIFYDVTYASDEFKKTHKEIIREIKISGKKETKSFLKSIADKFKNVKEQPNIIDVVDSNAPSLSSLMPKELQKVSNPCQFISTKEGLKKKEILTQRQIDENQPLYYDVTNLVLSDVNLWSKIYQDTIELKKQSNGFYVQVDELNNQKNQSK